MKKSTELASLVLKTAGILCDAGDEPLTNPELQSMVGDPNDARTSTFAQFKPNPGTLQIPNPLSPIEGDEIFFAYFAPGAAFQSHDGQQWTILDYPWQGVVSIENRWNPRVAPQVSVYDIRRSIDQWIEPIQQTVPPPPPGVDYGTLKVRMVENDETDADALRGKGMAGGAANGGW